MKKSFLKTAQICLYLAEICLSWRMFVLIKLDEHLFSPESNLLLWGSILKLLEMAGSLITSSTPEYHHCHHSYNYFHHRQNLQLWPFLRHCIVTIRTLIITWNNIIIIFAVQPIFITDWTRLTVAGCDGHFSIRFLILDPEIVLSKYKMILKRVSSH